MKKILLLNLLLITACNGNDVAYDYPLSNEQKRENASGSLVTNNPDGFMLFGKGKTSANTGSNVATTHLWQAALESIVFMPIATVDASSGLIITDWYEDSDLRGERFKLNIFVDNKGEMKASSLIVTAFKQKLDKSGNWRDEKVTSNIVNEIEEKILNKARELKIRDRK